MGGSSESVTVGYKYYVGMHMALCHGPIDKLVRIRVGGKDAWVGNAASGSLLINKPDLFGGEKREGGVSGQVDIETGGPTQGQNSYLAAKLGADLLPAFRGVCCAVLRQVYVGLNPYLKDWGWWCQRIHTRSCGQPQWYDSKAAIGYKGFSDIILPIHEDDVMSLNAYTVTVPPGSLDGCIYLTSQGLTHDLSKQAAGMASAVWNGTLAWRVGKITFNFFLHTTVNYRHAMQLTFTDASGNSVLTFQPWDWNFSNCPSVNGSPIASSAVSALTSYRVTITDTGTNLNFEIEDSLGTSISSVTLDGSLAGVKGYNFQNTTPTNYLTGTINSYSSVNIYQYNDIAGEDRYGETSDMNPAHIIRECLTDPHWGMGYPEADIHDASFIAAADTLFSEGMGMSIIWSQQTPLDDFVDDILRHIDAAVYVDRSTGKFVLKLIRGDYDESSLLVLDKSNISHVEGYTKQTMAELANEITVTYYSNDVEGQETVTLQNLAMIQQQGAVIPATVEYQGFTSQSVAARVAARDLKAMSSPLISATLYANREAAGLNIGDVFTWGWTEEDEAGDGVATSYIMRVTEISFGDGVDNVVRVQCVQDVFALPDITYVEAEEVIWTDPSSPAEPADPRLVIEAPYYELVRAMGQDIVDSRLVTLPESGRLLVAAGRTAGEINASLYVDSGAGYVDAGNMDFSPFAELATGIGPLDTAATIIDVADMDDDVSPGELAQLGDELVEIVSVSGNTVTIKRAVLDTTPSTHSAGTKLIVWDRYAASDGVEYVASDEIGVKIAPSSSQGELPLADAPEDVVTMDSRAIRPYRPAKLAVNGNIDPDQETEQTYPLSISWAHRNRLQETAGTRLAWNDASITPEEGTTYVVEADVLSEAETVLGTIVDEPVSGSSRVYVVDDVEAVSLAAAAMCVRVRAVRDGYDSWREATIRFTLPANAFFSFADTFDTFDASKWQQVGLSSVSSVDGKLVVVPAQDTWSLEQSNMVKFIGGSLPESFEIEANLEWSNGGSALGQVFIMLKTESTHHGIGLYDGVNTGAPQFVTRCLGVDEGATTTTVSGSVKFKIKFLDGVMEYYRNDVLVLTRIIGLTPIQWMGLTCTRYTTYPHLSPKWSDISIVQLQSLLEGTVYRFPVADPALWNTSSLASATYSDGYMITEGRENTWAAFATNLAQFLGTLPSGDFEAEALLWFIYRSACLGEIYLYLEAGSEKHYVGLQDGNQSYDASQFASLNESTWTGARKASGNGIILKLKRVGTVVTAYINGTLVKTGASAGGAVTKIGLTNTRLTTYAGITAKWGYFRLKV